MSIIEKILNPFGYISEKQFNNKMQEAIKAEIDRVLPKWLGDTADAMKWNMPNPAIFANQADMYRISPILGTAVSILGSDLGTSKFNVKRMVGEETRDIPNHEYELLIRNPNPADSGIEFLRDTSSNYLLNGNAIWWLNRVSRNDKPDEIWPVPFEMITPVPDGRMYIDHYDYFPGAGKPPIRMETFEIVHFKTYNPHNRFIGLSPIESLAVTLSGDLAMRKNNTVNYAKHGGAPPSILAFRDFVAEPAWSDIKEKIDNARKRDEMMMLRGVGDGITWLQRALNNKDMDFVANLKQNMTDIFNRMCPGLIAMLDSSATEANALAARATYSEKTLWPLMEVIAQKVTSDILPVYGRKLIGVFDDPRVVDRKMKLDEQTAFERSHTIAEIRKEFYQDDPIGDERDNLLPSQIISKNNFQQSQEQNNQEQNINEQQSIDDMDENTEDREALKMELSRWQRKALKKVGQDVEFISDIIPEETMNIIHTSLPDCRNSEDIKKLFGIKVKRNNKDAYSIVKAIELALSVKNG